MMLNICFNISDINCMNLKHSWKCCYEWCIKLFEAALAIQV